VLLTIMFATSAPCLQTNYGDVAMMT